MINQRELDIMRILYEIGEPCTVMDIVNYELALTQSTVTAVLRKLLKSGFVEVIGVAHSGRVLSRTYIPTDSGRNYLRSCFAEVAGDFSSIFSADELCDVVKNLGVYFTDV